jgi:hypothetical protein
VVSLVVVVTVLSIVVGVVVALLPFRVAVAQDLEPAGQACWFELDPGSGPSAMGVEVRVGWLAQRTACWPIGPMGMATVGPEFGDAVTAPDPLYVVSGSDAERVLRANSQLPVYASVWPVAAGVVALALWIPLMVVVILVTRRREPPERRPGRARHR